MFKPLSMLLMLSLTGCANLPVLQMQDDLVQQIQAAGLTPDQVALFVTPLAAPLATPQAVPTTSGPYPQAPLLQHRPDALLQPASTMKLLTSAVALDQLGPLWRGETELLADPVDLALARQTGILQQPLYIRGKGDPDLDFAAVSSLLSQLYIEGVRELRGGLLLDRSYFQPLLPDGSAPPFDESPRARYNYIPDALGINQGMLQLRLKSDGHQVRLFTLPVLQDLQLVAALTLTNSRCDQFNADQLQLQERPLGNGQVQLTIAGEFPRNCLHEEEAAWLSRDQQWQLSVQQIWRQLGGRLTAKLVHGEVPANAVVVAQHFSRPLPQLLQQLNKNSDNGLARTLALQLGRLRPAEQVALMNAAKVQSDQEKSVPDSAGSAGRALASPGLSRPGLSRPGTTENAEWVISQWLQQHQVPTQGLVIDNGSGLSRLARLSARQLAGLLQVAWQQPWGLDLISSLPRSGVDGTLQNRMRQTTARDRARLKTGTLRNGTGLAGYVFDSKGQPWIFVGLVNAEDGVSKGRALLDQWVTQVSQF